MELTRVILHPYTTEKTYSIRNKSEHETLTFIVDKNANNCLLYTSPSPRD